MICANTVVRRKMGDSDMADVDVDAGPVSAAAVTSIEAAALGAARLAGGEGERALSEIASPTAGEAQGAVQPGEVAEGGTARKRFRSPSLTVGCVAVQLLLKNTTHAVHGQCVVPAQALCDASKPFFNAELQVTNLSKGGYYWEHGGGVKTMKVPPTAGAQHKKDEAGSATACILPPPAICRRVCSLHLNTPHPP